MNRRSFVQLSMLSAGAAAVGLAGRAAPAAPAHAARGLKLLVLGGTGLIGPQFVRHAVERGHTVTLFNRGRTKTDLFPDLEKLQGDRNGDLASVEAEIAKGRRWDAVVDNTASIPRWVTLSAGLLAEAADLYLYTSSISAYADGSKPADESSELATLSPEAEAAAKTPADITGENYGGLKARCEAEARAAFGDRTIVVRPGLIVGPDDYSDRFTYWPVRIARGGEVMAPGHPDDPVQFIDCRDLGEWYVRLLETRAVGTYNGVGPRSPMTVAGMLYGIRATLDNEISFTWVDADFLARHEVLPWAHMTVWVPPAGESGGLARTDVSRALAAGLTFRSLADTARDTLAWWNGLPEERRAAPRAGLAAEREREVLAAWRSRKPAPTAAGA